MHVSYSIYPPSWAERGIGPLCSAAGHGHSTRRSGAKAPFAERSFSPHIGAPSRAGAVSLSPSCGRGPRASGRLDPNPELAVEVENVGGSGSFAGTDSAEASLVLSQLIELGGKRGRREEGARYRTDLVDSEYRQVRWQVRAETVRRFLGVAAAQQNIQLAELSLELARESRETIRQRVQAGTTSDASLQRSAIAVTRAELAVDSARQQLASARVRSEEHTSELQSRGHLVCRLLLEKKKK